MHVYHDSFICGYYDSFMCHPSSTKPIVPVAHVVGSGSHQKKSGKLRDRWRPASGSWLPTRESDKQSHVSFIASTLVSIVDCVWQTVSHVSSMVTFLYSMSQDLISPRGRPNRVPRHQCLGTRSVPDLDLDCQHESLTNSLTRQCCRKVTALIFEHWLVWDCSLFYSHYLSSRAFKSLVNNPTSQLSQVSSITSDKQ